MYRVKVETMKGCTKFPPVIKKAKEYFEIISDLLLKIYKPHSLEDNFVALFTRT